MTPTGDNLPELAQAMALADRLFNAVIVLYGAAREMGFAEWESEDAELHQRVIDRAESDLGPDLLRQVQDAVAQRAARALVPIESDDRSTDA